jgi:hypothetical protein
MTSMDLPVTELADGSESPARAALLAEIDIAAALGDPVAGELLSVRVGRVAFFAHDPQPTPDVPAAVQKWLVHEESILSALNGGSAIRRPLTDWVAGAPWVVWRLLSGNNREIGRGVGVYGSLTAARTAAERAMVESERAQPAYVFDRRSSHGWCLRLAGEALVVSPLWHRSRRSNRLNLATVRVTLGRAEVNNVATQLGGVSRMRPEVPA